MKQLNRTNVQANKYPERIIQFGEGNFFTGFCRLDHLQHESKG